LFAQHGGNAVNAFRIERLFGDKDRAHAAFHLDAEIVHAPANLRSQACPSKQVIE
jgi:hypothetical protein